MSMRYTGKNWKEVRRSRRNKPWPQTSTYDSIVAAKKRVTDRQEKAFYRAAILSGAIGNGESLNKEFVYNAEIKSHRGDV